MEYKVGQKVWVVPSSKYSKPYEDEITKIGRRWITLGGFRPQRFDPNNGHLDGGAYSSPGKVYLSEEAHRLHVALAGRWSALRNAMPHAMPTHVTLDDIQTMERILRVKPD